jgi:hypothetical protein
MKTLHRLRYVVLYGGCHRKGILGFLRKTEKKLARSFNFTFRYVDDVLSLNNSRFGDFIDGIYLIEFEIKDSTNTARSAHTLTYTSKLTVSAG